MFKTVSLPQNTWQAICTLIEASPTQEDHRYAAMIREQTSGAVNVKARGGSVTVKATKGSDLRDAKFLR